MKYKCIIFDHDDTTVNSTAEVHFPCFLEFLKVKGIDFKCTLEEYVKYNFEPGLLKFYKDICKMSPELMEEEYKFWIEYAKHHRAVSFKGIKEIMEEHKRNGGILTVVSHSYGDNILRDYEYNGLPKPDLIFGFEQPREELKPSPIPVFKIMKEYNLEPKDVVVIDDLKPGYLMAKASGVDFIASSWCFKIEENIKYMKEHAKYFCNSVEELKEVLK